MVVGCDRGDIRSDEPVNVRMFEEITHGDQLDRPPWKATSPLDPIQIE
jgi:hypothetical protein